MTYDVIVPLPSVGELKPGMSAEVQVTIARREHVLLIPLSAVREDEDGAFCWVGAPDKAQQRRLELGDSNDEFAVVESGLAEGEQVVIDLSEPSR